MIVNGLKHILGAICYYGGIDSLFYWLNRRAKRVVTFHNVLPDGLMTREGKLPVALTESAFWGIVREATRFLVADTDLDAKGTLTITFDDGYLNQYEVVPKVLQREGVNAAVLFVSDDVVTTGTLSVDVDLHRGLSYSDEYRRLRLTGVTLNQIEDLRSRGWKVGYHTKHHLRLSEMTTAEKREALRPPKWLKDNILSYPFGKPKDVDRESVEIAAEFGYEKAYSNQCENDGFHCRHFLPRMVLFPDKYWIHFELSGAKYFFKWRRLLPR